MVFVHMVLLRHHIVGKSTDNKSVYNNWKYSTNCSYWWKPWHSSFLTLSGRWVWRRVSVIKNVFQKVGITFKSCIDKFHLCKSLVQVDRAFPYGKYKVTLVVVIA